MAMEWNSTNPASPLAYSADQTALLLLDYHQMIFGRLSSENVASIVQAANSMSAWAEANNIPIYHCLINLEEAPSPVSRMYQRIVSMGPMLAENPSLADEHPEIASSYRLHSIYKRTPGVISALKSKGLAAELERRGIKSVVMCGLLTHGCLLSTARACADEGVSLLASTWLQPSSHFAYHPKSFFQFATTIIENGCGGPQHDALAEEALGMTAWLLQVDDFIKEWEAQAGKRH